MGWLKRLTEPQDRMRYEQAQIDIQDVFRQMVDAHARWTRERGRLLSANISLETREEALETAWKNCTKEIHALQPTLIKILSRNGFSFFERGRICNALNTYAERAAQNKGDADNALMAYYDATHTKTHIA